jgi:hypothetical protein
MMMSEIKIQFIYKGQLRIGTVEIDPQNRKGLITLKTAKGYRSYHCDEITDLMYIG